MKHVPMKQRKDKPVPVEPPAERPPDAAFDLWLQRGLQELYGDIAKEEIPEELLKILREGGKK